MNTGGTDLPNRFGEWLSSDQAFLDRWLATMIRKTHTEERALHPVIAEFQNLIEGDSQIFMLFHQMFEQVPRKPPYNKDPTGKPQVRDYRHMLQLLNTILTHAPEFNKSGLVGCPINTIFDWPMGTLRIRPLQNRASRQATRQILDQIPAVLDRAYARE